MAIVTRINYHDPENTREEALQIAQNFLTNQITSYNLTFANCECIATYCWTNRYIKIKCNGPNFTQIDTNHCKFKDMVIKQFFLTAKQGDPFQFN